MKEYQPSTWQVIGLYMPASTAAHQMLTNAFTKLHASCFTCAHTFCKQHHTTHCSDVKPKYRTGLHILNSKHSTP
jgi:hypothetical protein